MLERLSQDYRLVLLTNGGFQNQSAKLTQAGLENYFTINNRFISAVIGFEKPDIRAFYIVLKMLGIQPENALMIGDNPLNDIDGAKNAGLQTCWVKKNDSFPSHLNPPDFTISFENLGLELLDLLEEIAQV